MPAFDIDEPGWDGCYERGTTSWTVWWVDAKHVALQADDMLLYMQADPGWYQRPWLSLTLGDTYKDQRPAITAQPHGTFTVNNRGDGDFNLVADSGQTIAVRRDINSWRQMGWGCWGIDVGTPPDSSYALLRVDRGGHLPLLLLTGSGTGLTLADVDLAQNGWISSLAGTDFSGAGVTEQTGRASGQEPAWL